MGMLKKYWNRNFSLVFGFFLVLVIVSCENKEPLKIIHGNLVFEMNNQMQTKILSLAEGLNH